MTTETPATRPYFPGREFAFHPKDIAIWDALLKEMFPHIRYYDDLPGAAREANAGPPDLRLRTTMFGGGVPWIELVLDPAWSPNWLMESAVLGRTTWNLLPSLHPNARILLGGEIHENPYVSEGLPIFRPGFPDKRPDAFYPPHVKRGEIYFRCDKDKPEHMRIAQRALRLITKIATNKVLWVHYPSMQGRPITKGGSVWCGFHALNWCRKAPDRFLAYTPLKEGDQGYGCRPLD